jgi:hypothetical protein
VQLTLEQIDLIKRLADLNPEHLTLVTSVKGKTLTYVTFEDTLRRRRALLLNCQLTWYLDSVLYDGLICKVAWKNVFVLNVNIYCNLRA